MKWIKWFTEKIQFKGIFCSQMKQFYPRFLVNNVILTLFVVCTWNKTHVVLKKNIFWKTKLVKDCFTGLGSKKRGKLHNTSVFPINPDLSTALQTIGAIFVLCLVSTSNLIFTLHFKNRNTHSSLKYGFTHTHLWHFNHRQEHSEFKTKPNHSKDSLGLHFPQWPS